MIGNENRVGSNRRDDYRFERDRAAARFGGGPLAVLDAELLARFGRNPDDLNTVYVIAGYRSDAPALCAKARAALFIMRTLGAPWNWVGVLGVLPDGVLNRGYDLIARNRYRWFGRYQSCILPGADNKDRFIDA